MTQTKSGYIAIVGRPNVGKSTLLNCLLGTKLSITSPKPQTTRGQVLGIKTTGDIQAIFIDTPGLHKVEKRAINRYMNKTASAFLHDADVILFVIDATRWEEEDELVLEKLKNEKSPVFLVINKVDTLADKQLLLPLIEKLQNKFPFASIFPISARKAENVAELEKAILPYLPEGPHFYPEGEVTDKSIQFRMAELIREKIIKQTEQEVPYSTAVTIEDFKQEGNRTEISAIIWVEREGQKIILVGSKGERLKNIGIHARKDIETLLGCKVMLRLWVKVKEHWTDSDSALKSLGLE